jgi:hypothetical protein
MSRLNSPLTVGKMHVVRSFSFQAEFNSPSQQVAAALVSVFSKSAQKLLDDTTYFVYCDIISSTP